MDLPCKCNPTLPPEVAVIVGDKVTIFLCGVLQDQLIKLRLTLKELDAHMQACTAMSAGWTMRESTCTCIFSSTCSTWDQGMHCDHHNDDVSPCDQTLEIPMASDRILRRTPMILLHYNAIAAQDHRVRRV